MKKWIWLVVALLIALGGYVAAGPYLTVRAIREAVKTEDTAALTEQVDFDALRASLKLQLKDRMVREVGSDWQSNLLGAIGLSIGSGVISAAVDTMVTPVGLGAMMEGRAVWKNVRDDLSTQPAEPAQEALHDARYRYESLSRFTATVQDEDGDPVVFVFARKGLRWKLADIRLPLTDPSTP